MTKQFETLMGIKMRYMEKLEKDILCVANVNKEGFIFTHIIKDHDIDVTFLMCFGNENGKEIIIII